jgi:hypothetical protein
MLWWIHIGLFRTDNYISDVSSFNISCHLHWNNVEKNNTTLFHYSNFQANNCRKRDRIDTTKTECHTWPLISWLDVCTSIKKKMHGLNILVNICGHPNIFPHQSKMSTLTKIKTSISSLVYGSFSGITIIMYTHCKMS